MDTSPDDVKEVGSPRVMADSETENRDEPLSRIFNRLPISPLAPIFNLSRSPVATVGFWGDQSIRARLPVEKEEEDEDRVKPVPVDNWSNQNRAPVSAPVPVDTLEDSVNVPLPGMRTMSVLLREVDMVKVPAESILISPAEAEEVVSENVEAKILTLSAAAN